MIDIIAVLHIISKKKKSPRPHGHSTTDLPNLGVERTKISLMGRTRVTRCLGSETLDLLDLILGEPFVVSPW